MIFERIQLETAGIVAGKAARGTDITSTISNRLFHIHIAALA